MRNYIYDKKTFARSVTFTGVFCGLIAAYSLWALLMGQQLFWFVLLVACYQVFNTFVSISNPAVVSIDEQSISFAAYGKTHRYPLDEITTFRVKELDYGKKMYVRVNEGSLLRGRYWLLCKQMNDGQQLWDYCAWLEYQKEPDQLKFRTRSAPKNPFEQTLDLKEESDNNDLE